MKKLKRILLIVLIIVSIAISSYAATRLHSNKVTYGNVNVESAIDNLYKKAQEKFNYYNEEAENWHSLYLETQE